MYNVFTSLCGLLRSSTGVTGSDSLSSMFLLGVSIMGSGFLGGAASVDGAAALVLVVSLIETE